MVRLAPLSLALFTLQVSGVMAGTQFITGPCTSDSDCAEGCCGFNTGLCAGPIIALTRDGGCGHGDGEPNANAANALGQGTFTVSGAASKTTAATTDAAANTTAAAATTDAVASGTSTASTAKGTQFITGACTSDSDCAEGCCGFNTGLCAGPIIALTRDGGCGHGDAEPNANAANALGQGTFTVSGAASTAAAAAATAAAATATTMTTTVATSTTTNKGAGNGVGAQFITGDCDTDADCASGCCGFNTGLCAGAVVAQERDGGCGHGNSEPNDNAAKALGAKRGLWDD